MFWILPTVRLLRYLLFIIRRCSPSTGVIYYVVFINAVWSTVPPSLLKKKREKMLVVLITVQLTLLSYQLLAIPLGMKLASLTEPCSLALSMWREMWLVFCSSHVSLLWSAKSEIMLCNLEWQAALFYSSVEGVNNQRVSVDKSKPSRFRSHTVV